MTDQTHYAGNGRGPAAGPPPSPGTVPGAGPVPVMPVAMRFTVGQGQTADGKLWAVLQVEGATGMFVAFLDREAARSVMEGLAKVVAAGNLLLAPPGPTA